MTPKRRIRDNALIDALDNIPAIHFSGLAWRVVREDRDPVMCSASGGRWDDGTFDVLYTSETANGATAEMHYHLSRGQPVIPSKVAYHLHELTVTIKKTLKLADLDAIKAMGVDTKRYGALSYPDRQTEYPRTQEVGETAHFVGFDGLIVPNARWECMNIILFCDRIPPDATEAINDHGPINWDNWRKHPFDF